VQDVRITLKVKLEVKDIAQELILDSVVPTHLMIKTFLLLKVTVKRMIGQRQETQSWLTIHNVDLMHL
jgi:hypothetical protein